MEIGTVPGRLFEEFSKKYGKGEIEKITNRWDLYQRFQELDETKTGFEGAIGYRESGELTSFALWPRVPTGEQSVFEPYPVLKISAAPQRDGTWAYGSGNLMHEKVTAELELLRGLDLACPSAKLVAETIGKAAELTMEATSATYWERDLNPQFSYEKPD